MRLPLPLAQLACVCVYRIWTREALTRAFYFALKEIAAEQQRCERVLGMLLPPTLVSSYRSVVVDAAKGDVSISDGRKSRGNEDPGSSGKGVAVNVLSVVSAGSERFAEAFESASVLFAEGTGEFTH